MKRLVVALLPVWLGGCTVFVRTAPVPYQEAKAAPVERLLAYQEKKEGYLPLVVTRDEGYMGSGCYLGLEVDGTLAARLDPAETATFYAPPGELILSVVADPSGRALCSVAWQKVIERYTLEPGQPNLYRISLGAYRRPRVVPAPE